MINFVISEETVHLAARFLERWKEKSPGHEHEKAEKQLRDLSNYLIENLYSPMFITIVRAKKK